MRVDISWRQPTKTKLYHTPNKIHRVISTISLSSSCPLPLPTSSPPALFHQRKAKLYRDSLKMFGQPATTCSLSLSLFTYRFVKDQKRDHLWMFHSTETSQTSILSLYSTPIVTLNLSKKMKKKKPDKKWRENLLMLCFFFLLYPNWCENSNLVLDYLALLTWIAIWWMKQCICRWKNMGNATKKEPGAKKKKCGWIVPLPHTPTLDRISSNDNSRVNERCSASYTLHNTM